jgi:alpha-D-xyloside xylohydrolase
MPKLLLLTISLGMSLGSGLALSAGAQVGQTNPKIAPATPAESPVEEAEVTDLVRLDAGTLTLTLPAKAGSSTPRKLLLYDFEFEGAPVRTDKLHFKQLAPGVVEVTSLAYMVGEWRVRLRDNASYYGLGEHFDTLNHAHSIVKNASQDNPGPKGTSSYKPIPFFMSTTGYGLWCDTTGDATFDMDASSNTDILLDATAEKLRLVLFTGPEFPKILDAFTALAGRSILPPYWAFAPWLGRDYHQNQAQVTGDVDRARELGLPASVLLIDSPWATGYNSYKFNPKQFDNAAAMVKHIHGQGYKLVLWHTPWINVKSNPPGEAGFAGKIDVESSNYAEAAAAGYFVKNANGTPYVGHWWKGEGSMIDFTNSHAKLWWQDQVRQAIHAGADGFKDDDGEGTYVGDVRFADGTDPRLMRNRYAVLYNNAMEELIQKDLKGDGTLFIRSVTTGANGLGLLWGGDSQASFSVENGLPTVVTAGLNAGLSGMPLWTADLGAYEKTATTPDPTLFMRWTEYAAFSPAMETLSTSNMLPWDYGDQALAVYRKFSRLHMSLFPYRYAAAQEAAKNGMPIMRALVLEYQDDEQARAARDEYLFGPDMLVAPVVNEGTQRAVYLPAGAWIDYWTGAQIPGGKTIVVDAPVDTIPLFVRQGTVLPRLPDDVMTLVPQSESGNKIVSSMDGRRVFEIVGDGGPTNDTTRTDFEGRTFARTGNTLTITGDSTAHILVRWRFARVQSVTVNGASAKLDSSGSESFVEFEHTHQSVVAWQ